MFLLDIIKLMAHNQHSQITSLYMTYLLHWTWTFNVPHAPFAVFHKSYLVSRPGFSVDLIFLCTMFTLLTAFLTIFPLDGLPFVLGETSSLCVEDRVRTIFFPLTKIKILHQITTLSTITFLVLASYIFQDSGCIPCLSHPKHKFSSL
jgi:putative flippase GtrA